MIFSSKVIPGNEAGIINLQNLFAKKGINIITGKDEFVHVSGHPCQDELTEMYKLIKPKSIIPVHGEFRHLVANANLAKKNGIKNSLVIENGTIVKISKNDTSIDKQVESGRLYKDGKIIIYDYESPSNVRSKISFTGLIIISLVLQNNKIKSKILGSKIEAKIIKIYNSGIEPQTSINLWIYKSVLPAKYPCNAPRNIPITIPIPVRINANTTDILKP